MKKEHRALLPLVGITLGNYTVVHFIFAAKHKINTYKKERYIAKKTEPRHLTLRMNRKI